MDICSVDRYVFVTVGFEWGHSFISMQWIKHILIREATVLGEAPPDYWGADQGEAEESWKAWDEEEAIYTGHLR